jgi:hypothetical protein
VFCIMRLCVQLRMSISVSVTHLEALAKTQLHRDA